MEVEFSKEMDNGRLRGIHERFRPVELTEYVRCNEDIFIIDWKSEETLELQRKLPSGNKSI